MLMPALVRALPVGLLRALMALPGRAAADRDERLLRLLARHKRWADANAYITAHDLGPGDVRSDWLLNHVRQCGARSDAIVGGPDAVARRIAQLGTGDTVLQTRTMRAGLMNFAMFRHRLRSSDGTVRSVIEKMYVATPYRRGHVEEETLLFREIDHRRLQAPALLGTSLDDGLLSIFYACAPGRPPSRRQFEHARGDLVAALWQVRPTPAIVRACTARARRALQSAQALLDAPQARAVPRDVRDRIVACLDGVIDAAGSASFVSHADLHARNCLGPSGGPPHMLVDWEGFVVAPVGFGLAVSPERFAKDAFRAWLSARLEPSGIPLHATLERIAIDQLLASLRRRDTQAVHDWTRALA